MTTKEEINVVVPKEDETLANGSIPVVFTHHIDEIENRSSCNNNSYSDNLSSKEEIRKEVNINDIIPSFWSNEPRAWFAHVDSLFARYGPITDHAKYCHVIVRLDKEACIEVRELMLNPPEEDKYEKIKAALITRLSITRDKKMYELIMSETMGDRKPSEFLEHLRQLAGSLVPEKFVKAVWFRCMPKKIQNFIPLQNDLPLENLANLADYIHIVSSSQDINGSSKIEPHEQQMNVLLNKIDDLTLQVSELSTLLRSRRSRSKSRNNREPLCWYHQHFGERAINCVSPCNFNAVF